MAAGKILGMALEAIGKGADEVADVAKAGKSAARKALDAVAEAADDWGWKGGKPGEITGGELIQKIADTKSTDAKSRLLYDFEVQLDQSKYPGVRIAFDDMREYAPLSSRDEYGYKYASKNMAAVFAELEKADIPREWTGRVMDAIGSKVYKWYRKNMPYHARSISAAMRPMNNEQRGIFLSALSNWKKPVEDLYAAAGPMSKLTKEELETFVSLLPEWEGTLEDLADLARNI